jgi:hypothetical protein
LPHHGRPFSIRVDLPPLSALFLQAPPATVSLSETSAASESEPGDDSPAEGGDRAATPSAPAPTP